MTSRPLPDLDGVYYAIVEGQWESLPSNNVFTFTVTPPAVTGAADVAVATQVAIAIKNRWAAFADLAFHESYDGVLVKVYPLHTPMHPAVVEAIVAPGGIFGTIAPGMVAAAVAHDVLRRGRGSQSRSSFSPLAATSIDSTGRELSVGYKAALQTAFDNFRSDVLTDVDTAVGGVVTSYVQLSKGTPAPPLPIVVPPQTYDITESRVENLLTTQRRRMRRNS